MNKRFFGWLSWKMRRSHEYRREVAEALFDDIKEQAPDHVAVTGDLINISLPHEFEAGARMLKTLGTADWVSVVPGNHDAYVAMPYERAWAHWTDYLQSDAGEGEASGAATGEGDPRGGKGHKANPFPYPDTLPTVRIREGLALVGVCTALPTPPFVAAGMVGEAQLAALETTLNALRERDLCRVVLVHHPVVDDHVSPRRRLRDSPKLRGVLERAGAELVIHGHNHRSEFKELASRDGVIPIVGVRSGSYGGENKTKTAQYHLYQIERSDGTTDERFKITLRTREWCESSGTFDEVGETRALPLRQ